MKKYIVFVMIVAIALAPLFRGLFFTFEASAFLALMALLSFLYFMVKLSHKEPLHLNKWLLLLNVLLVLAYLLAFTKAIYLRDHIRAVLQYAEYALVSIVLYDFYHDRKEKFYKALMITVVLSGFINAVIGTVALSRASAFLRETLNGSRVGGTLQYANTVAILYGICIIFAITLISASESRFFRLLLMGIGNIVFLAMWLTGSRGGMLIAFPIMLLALICQPKGHKLKTLFPLIALMIPAIYVMQRIYTLRGHQNVFSIVKWMVVSWAAAVILGLIAETLWSVCKSITLKAKAVKAVKISMTVLVIGVAAILLIQYKDILLSLIPKNIITRFQAISFNEVNIFLRLTFYLDAIRIIGDHFLMGAGGGSFASLIYPIQEIFYRCRDVHNHYLQVFVEAGVLAFLGFLSMVVLSLFNYLKDIIKGNGSKARIDSVGLFCAFIALAAHSLVDFDLSFVSIAILFWVFMIGSVVNRSEKGPGEKAQHKSQLTMKKPWILLLLAVLSSLLLSVNAHFATSGYNGFMGTRYLSANYYPEAYPYFETAKQLDPLSSDYPLHLAVICNHFADSSKKADVVSLWRDKAVENAERCVAVNPQYPENTEILVETYLKAGRNRDALDKAEALLRMQPMVGSNYGLIAQCYLAVAQEDISANHMEQAKEILMRCSELNIPEKAEEFTDLEAYKQQALELLTKFN